jgi:hypothetical protein
VNICVLFLCISAVGRRTGIRSSAVEGGTVASNLKRLFSILLRFIQMQRTTTAIFEPSDPDRMVERRSNSRYCSYSDKIKMITFRRTDNRVTLFVGSVG